MILGPIDSDEDHSYLLEDSFVAEPRRSADALIDSAPGTTSHQSSDLLTRPAGARSTRRARDPGATSAHPPAARIAPPSSRRGSAPIRGEACLARSLLRRQPVK